MEAVAPGDVREDRGEGVPGEGDLGGVAAEDPAQGYGTAQVDAVGAGGGAAVVAEGRVGDEVIDGGAGGTDAGLPQFLVQGGRDVGEQAGAADLPLPPVAVAGGGRVVDGGGEVVEAAQDAGAEAGVGGGAGALLDVGLGHGPQAAVAEGDAGRRVEGVAGPEGVRRRGHARVQVAGECAGLGEPGGVGLGRGVVAGAEGDVEPPAAEGVVRIARRVGTPARGRRTPVAARAATASIRARRLGRSGMAAPAARRGRGDAGESCSCPTTGRRSPERWIRPE